MNDAVLNAKSKVDTLDSERIRIVSEMSQLNVWLANKNLSDLKGNRVNVKDYQTIRAKVVQDKYEKEAKLLYVKADLKAAKVALSNVEHDAYVDEKRREKAPDRIEKQLIHQCASVFENMERRGLGFSFNEKKIIEKVREYVMQL